MSSKNNFGGRDFFFIFCSYIISSKKIVFKSHYFLICHSQNFPKNYRILGLRFNMKSIRTCLNLDKIQFSLADSVNFLVREARTLIAVALRNKIATASG